MLTQIYTLPNFQLECCNAPLEAGTAAFTLHFLQEIHSLVWSDIPQNYCK